MKNSIRFCKLGISLILCIVLALYLAPVCAQAAAKVELKAISFMPANVSKSRLFKQYLEKAEQESNGELSIKFLGGPEVIGLMEQGQGVARGVVDMALLPPSLIQSLVPRIPGHDIVPRTNPGRRNRSKHHR